MKKLLSASLISIIMIVIGICLLINPLAFTSWLFYIIGAAAIVLSAVKFIIAYNNGTTKTAAFTCSCLLAFGIVLCILQAKVLEIIPLIIGICLLVYGATKLHGAFAFKGVEDIIFKKLVISASISIILSLVIIFFSGTAIEIVLRIIGAILMYNAAENIFSCTITNDKRNSDENKEAIEAHAEETTEQKGIDE